jgi:PAS domain S-box-containing protein
MEKDQADQEQIRALTEVGFLYQHAPTGQLSFDASGRIVRMNNTLANWLGLEDQEQGELTFSDLVNKAGGYYYQMFITPLLNLHGHVNEINLSMKTDTGTIDVLFNAIGYKNTAGRLHLINATVQRISDRKKYEQELMYDKKVAEDEKRRFEFLSNTIPTMIWTAEPNGRINFVNDQVKGYFDVSNLTNTTALRAIFKEDRAGLLRDWKRFSQTGETLDREVRLQPAAGDAEWFVLRAVPYRNEQGIIELWFGSCTNINKRKQLQLARYFSLSDNLLVARKKLTENTGVFNEIALSQSHTIRKPVANILGLLPMLQQESLSEEGRNVLSLLLESANELDQAVKQVVKKSASRL